MNIITVDDAGFVIDMNIVHTHTAGVSRSDCGISIVRVLAALASGTRPIERRHCVLYCCFNIL